MFIAVAAAGVSWRQKQTLKGNSSEQHTTSPEAATATCFYPWESTVDGFARSSC